MREPTMYQFILREGRAEGRTEGRTDGERALVLKLLTRKLGHLPLDITTKVSDLNLEELETLAEAIFDFTSVGDLESWLG